MPYELLSEPIRKYIRDKGWEQLRPIQNVAISKIMGSNENYILASRTASGKTEAAFLPILSKLNFNESGVLVLYVSPLIALINDQFFRIEELCKNLEITVTKWHGEANKTMKDKLVKLPNGIVLITPESLEAMFVHKPYNISKLFSNLKYVVIDEIHSFLGKDRGIQLQSLLSRLQLINVNTFSIVGLSATIGDYNEAKKFTGNATNTKVLLDRTAKEITSIFRFFKCENSKLSLELLKDLYIETKGNKVLIFPNSRGRTEEVAVKLKKISSRFNGHQNYFAHHSSVHKDIREYVEKFTKNNIRDNFCISCTSTLELGIDIGFVDKVVQIDATHSIASLIQRVGRSGRKEGETSNLFLYVTNEWSLLQAISCWLLFKESYIEPSENIDKPYDVLVHQALSITKGHSGLLLNDLINQLKNNTAFDSIELSEIREIIQYLIEIDILEKLQNEVIIGFDGEKVVNNREFYSVFKNEESFKVVNIGNTIGEIPFSPQIIENENILLAAKIWKIIFIDENAKRIEVLPAKDGKNPSYYGEGAVVHQKIREKMMEVLYSNTEYDFLDEPCIEELKVLRRDFSVFKIKNLMFERPIKVSINQIELFTFTGTKINRTLDLLFNIAGIKNSFNDLRSSFNITLTFHEFISKLSDLLILLNNIDTYIATILKTKPSVLDFSKFGIYLPENYQIQLIKNRYFDIKQTQVFLETLKLIQNV